MLIKKLKLLIVCSVLVSVLVSCTKGGDNTNEYTADKSISGLFESDNSAKTNGENVITIYLSDRDNYMLSAVTEYNAKHNDIPIVVNEFDNATQYEEIKEKLTVELMAGEGPDIIYAFGNLFPSLTKTLESGIFYDLNNLIDKDTEFKLSDYNQIILDSGIINGRRYVLPIGYTVPIIWTTRGVLEKNNINIDGSEWTWLDFFSEAKKYMDNHKGEDKYFAGFYFETSFVMNYICNELVDNKNKKSKFNSAEFIKFLEDYKVISESLCSSEKMVQGALYNYLKSDSIVIFDTGLSLNPSRIFNTNSVVEHLLNENMLIFNIPSLNEKNLKWAKPAAMVGINKNSIHKEKAFEFFKILLSEEFQSRLDVKGTPVNINAYKNEAARYSGDNVKALSAGYYDASEPVEGVPLPPEIIKNMDDVINNTRTCSFVDESIVEIATAEVDEYLKGSKSAEATAKAIDDKVQLYMNE